jgi:hypothetical protein
MACLALHQASGEDKNLGLLQFVWEVDLTHNVWLCLNQIRGHLTRNHVISETFFHERTPESETRHDEQ